MEQINLHKQKLYSLIIAGIALIAMMLPWLSFSFLGGLAGGNANGFRGWGILSLFGIFGVVAACFLGNKTEPFDETFKKVALASFAAMALGALLFFVRLNSSALGDVVNSGIGLWICLAAGVFGVIWVLGKVKLPDPKKPG
jgi:hypothetical protein